MYVMFILETKHINEQKGTLIYTESKCMIQNMIMDDTTLEEIIVPVIHGEDSEMSIIIDDTLSHFLKLFSIVHFDDTHAHFGEISYKYEKGDVLTWETRLPKKIGTIEHLPTKILPNGYSTIKVFENKLIINDTIEKNIFYKFNNFDETVHVDMDILKKVFEKHPNVPFTIYLEESFPLCIEIIGQYTIRYYVAPMEI